MFYAPERGCPFLGEGPQETLCVVIRGREGPSLPLYHICDEFVYLDKHHMALTTAVKENVQRKENLCGGGR